MKRVCFSSLLCWPDDLERVKLDLQSHPGIRIKNTTVWPGTLHGSGRDACTLWLESPRELLVAIQRIQDSIETWVEDELVVFKREECRFTTRELDQAELLSLDFNRAGVHSWRPRECFETDFGRHPDIDNPPPWCWLASEIRLTKEEIGSERAGLNHCLVGFILIHDWLLEALPLFSLNARSLSPVAHRPTGDKLPWHHFQASTTLPPLHEQTTGIERGEPCGPNGIMENYHALHEGYHPAMSRDLLMDTIGGIPDVSFTHELFGGWHRTETGWNGLPTPRLMVSQSMRKALKEAGVTRLRYTPCRLV